ncbi:hypothetical protein ACHAWF_003718 [Thalassiosira exigua]
MSFDDDNIPQKDEAITHAQAMQNLLTDEELSDLTLKGDDGITVKTHRCMLAARSSVFRRMLYGQFAEASSDVVELGYSGKVLQSIVEFIYTDSASVLREDANDANELILCQQIMSLATAADYFNLIDLARKAVERSHKLMHDQPSLACPFLIACRATSIDSSTKRIEEYAWYMLRNNIQSIRGSKSFAYLTPTLLEDIVKDDQVVAQELDLFLLIKHWAEADLDQSKNPRKNNDTMELDMSNKRLCLSKELMQYLHLEHINPTDLSTIVATSGLVEPSQLLDAFKTQALDANAKGHCFARSRPLQPVWRTSKDSSYVSEADLHETEVLDCPVMRCGKYRWTLEFDSHCHFMWAGVASTIVPPLKDQWLGKQDGGWAYGSNGSACHATEVNNDPYVEGHPKFREGAKVTFTLDLTGHRDGNGTLCASMCRSSSFQICSRTFQVTITMEVLYLPYP